MVVSSDTPRMVLGDQRPALGSAARESLRSRSRMTPHSSGSVSGLKSGTLPAFRTRRPCGRGASRRRRRRRSGRGRCRPARPAPRSVQSPVLLERLALPGVDRDALGIVGRARPGPTATAAAAWSWVEKMLQLTQRTSGISGWLRGRRPRRSAGPANGSRASPTTA